MEDKRLIATKKDIIIFFIFAFSFTIFSCMYIDIEDFFHKFSICLFYFIQPVLAILINSFIKFMNIKNEKFLKITKILFNIFSFIFIIFMGVFTSFIYTFNKYFYKDMNLYKESSELTLNIIQNFIC